MNTLQIIGTILTITGVGMFAYFFYKMYKLDNDRLEKITPL